VSRLQEQYKNEIIPQLKEELGVSNALSVPKIEKITINMGLGSALGDKKSIRECLGRVELNFLSKAGNLLSKKISCKLQTQRG